MHWAESDVSNVNRYSEKEPSGNAFCHYTQKPHSHKQPAIPITITIAITLSLLPAAAAETCRVRARGPCWTPARPTAAPAPRVPSCRRSCAAAARGVESGMEKHTQVGCNAWVGEKTCKSTVDALIRHWFALWWKRMIRASIALWIGVTIDSFCPAKT